MISVYMKEVSPGQKEIFIGEEGEGKAEEFSN